MGPIGRVELIVNEHPDYLSPERVALNSSLRERLERASGLPVQVTHYLEVGSRLRTSIAMVLSGSVAPWSTYEPSSLARLREYVEDTEVPTLGICAGMQLLAQFAGGDIAPAPEAEFGYHKVEIVRAESILAGLPPTSTMYQQHTDHVASLPAEFEVIARNGVCVQALASKSRLWWGTQFHPERANEKHPDGARILDNFFDMALANVDAERHSQQSEQG